MCIWRSAAVLAIAMGWRVRLGGMFLLGMWILGRESDESLELQRDEVARVGEEVGSDGDESAGCAEVGGDCRVDCREASSTADL